MTMRGAIDYGTEVLLKAGIDEAKTDAWILFEFVAGINRTEFFLYPDREIGKGEYAEYKRLIEKRSSRYPLQYITNVQQFMGYDFYVDESVLIPRPETELLILEVERLISSRKPVKVLDMCTGSGCIGISLKLRNENCLVTAADISGDALEVAERNAEELGADVGFYKSDLFLNIPAGCYDIIVSNPPYIETDSLASLMREVRDFEPELALDGREDGLYFYREIIDKSKDFLGMGGKLAFEIGYNQAESVETLMKNAGFGDMEVIKDMSGFDRIVIGGI